MKTQYVVQTIKKSGWAWESYFKTEPEALHCFQNRSNDKSFESVRVWKESFTKAGTRISYQPVIKALEVA